MRRTGRHGVVLLAVAGLAAATAACGSSAAKPSSPPPSFADVLCGGGSAAWSAARDLLETPLLQQALDAGRFPAGTPSGPPAGAKWLIGGKIDKKIAESSGDYTGWATEPDVAAYLSKEENAASDVKNDVVCHSWNGSAAVAARVQAMTTGGFAFILCDSPQGWKDYLAFQDPVLLQAAFDSGRFAAGTPDAPPSGAPWFSAGHFLPTAAATSADYATWVARPDVATFLKTYEGVADSVKQSECQTSPSKGATTS